MVGGGAGGGRVESCTRRAGLAAGFGALIVLVLCTVWLVICMGRFLHIPVKKMLNTISYMGPCYETPEAMNTSL